MLVFSQCIHSNVSSNVITIIWGMNVGMLSCWTVRFDIDESWYCAKAVIRSVAAYASSIKMCAKNANLPIGLPPPSTSSALVQCL